MLSGSHRHLDVSSYYITAQKLPVPRYGITSLNYTNTTVNHHALMQENPPPSLQCKAYTL